MKRVFIYTRVSTLDQSTEIQVRELTQYCEQQGWNISEVFEDKASGSNTNRPAFKEMLRQIPQKKPNAILVYKLDRAFRSVLDMSIYVQTWSENKIEFISLKDPSLSLATPTGKLMLHLLGSFAEFERSIIIQRVRAGLDNAKRKGIKLGRPRRKNTDEIVELRNQGLTLKEIGKKVGLGESSISKILKSALELNPSEK